MAKRLTAILRLRSEISRLVSALLTEAITFEKYEADMEGVRARYRAAAALEKQE